MITDLLFGLPSDRPGGLVLTIGYFAASALSATAIGLIYAISTVALPRTGLALQGLSALLRGIPPLLLVFLCAHTPALSTGLAGLLALILYSFSHSGEILRGFLLAYPRQLRDQARLMGLSSCREWLELRLPWLLGQSLPALLSHWVSLLKDTGALIVVGIGELTTVAKSLSESSRSFEHWAATLLLAAGLYLLATLALIQLVSLAEGRLKRHHQRVRAGPAPTPG